jgi:hypothetical protein
MFKPILTALCVCASCMAYAQMVMPQVQALPKPGDYTPQRPQFKQFNTVAPSALPPPPTPTARSAPILQTSSHHQRTQATLTDLRTNTPSAISYSLPSKRHLHATNAYVTAFERFKAMLKGQTPTKEAVYTVENAYLDDHLSYEAFDRSIQQVVAQIRELARRNGEQPNHAHIQPMFRKNGTFPAFSYDHDDPWAEKDYRKQFVSELLTTRSGQCHSMPLLYKIITEELGLQARLAFSPGHAYIKYQGKNGDWHCFETTNGHPSSESWITASGMVKVEAMRSGIYLDTLNQQETIAFCLADLAQGYSIKFGMEPLVLEMIEVSVGRRSTLFTSPLPEVRLLDFHHLAHP